MLPSSKQITTAAEGLFILEDWHSFGQYYDKTLMAWYSNFTENWPKLKDTYSEKDLETAILNNLQNFITEMGTDFAFLARQKRLVIDNEDFYIDLLFYHRGLRSLVAIDLKLDKFRATHKRQMELYLRWLEKNEMREGENKPVGLILCSEKSPEQINYLLLDNDEQIKVAEYLTKLPDKKLLEQKLEEAIYLAQNRLKKIQNK